MPKLSIPLRSKGEMPTIGEDENVVLKYAKPLCANGKEVKVTKLCNLKFYGLPTYLDVEKHLSNIIESILVEKQSARRARIANCVLCIVQFGRRVNPPPPIELADDPDDQ